MKPGQILLYGPLHGRSVYQFTCPACLDPVEKPVDRKAAALLLAAGVDLATEESLLGDLHAADPLGGGPDQSDHTPGPPFTPDDILAIYSLLMDDTYIEEFLGMDDTYVEEFLDVSPRRRDA